MLATPVGIGKCLRAPGASRMGPTRTGTGPKIHHPSHCRKDLRLRRHRVRSSQGPTMRRRCDDVQGCVSLFVPLVL